MGWCGGSSRFAQTGLYSHRRMRNTDCTIRIAKVKVNNKLCSYCTADLRLCFRINQFSRDGADMGSRDVRKPVRGFRPGLTQAGMCRYRGWL